MTNALKIAIAGVGGRMGRELIRAGLAAGHQIVGGTERAGSPELGADLARLAGQGELRGVTVVDDPAEAAAGADLWIDFTTPKATLAALETLHDTKVKAAIIGTTGFTDDETSTLSAHADRLAIVKAGNFSLGIAVLVAASRFVAKRLGQEWDAEILETHHRRKVDAPSGTALMLGEAVAEGRGRPLSALQSAPYLGADAARQPGEIGFAVRRSGGVIGEHEVTFASETEVISLAHKALDRSVFAEGALAAAAWAANQQAGLYGIEDVLDLTGWAS